MRDKGFCQSLLPSIPFLRAEMPVAKFDERQTMQIVLSGFELCARPVCFVIAHAPYFDVFTLCQKVGLTSAIKRQLRFIFVRNAMLIEPIANALLISRFNDLPIEAFERLSIPSRWTQFNSALLESGGNETSGAVELAGDFVCVQEVNAVHNKEFLQGGFNKASLFQQSRCASARPFDAISFYPVRNGSLVTAIYIRNLKICHSVVDMFLQLLFRWHSIFSVDPPTALVSSTNNDSMSLEGLGNASSVGIVNCGNFIGGQSLNFIQATKFINEVVKSLRCCHAFIITGMYNFGKEVELGSGNK